MAARWVSRVLALAVALLGLALPAAAAGQAVSHDPRAFDVRVGLFPVAFQAGMVQSHFGSAARAEIDVLSHLSLGGFGRVGWLRFGKRADEPVYTAGALVHLHLVELVEEQGLSGTVYPEDAPNAGGGYPTGGDDTVGLTASQKLGGPRLSLPEVDRSLSALMRTTHSARLGYTYTRLALQRNAEDEVLSEADTDYLYVDNRMHAFSLGYAWSTHWNLHTGEDGDREVGFRRVYGDLLFAPEALAKTKRFYTYYGEDDPEIGAWGLRIGIEGTTAGFWSLLPGAGLAYSLELGGYYGEGHVAGYLFLALGLSLDLATGADD